VAYTLEQVDLVRLRLGVGYADAKQALDETDGDVIAALAILESQHAAATAAEQFDQTIARISEEVKQSLTGRPIVGLRLKLDDQTLAEVPVEVAGVGAILVSLLSSTLAHVRLETVLGDLAEAEQ